MSIYLFAGYLSSIFTLSLSIIFLTPTMNALIGDSRVRALKANFLGSKICDNWVKPGGCMLSMEELVKDEIIMHHGEDNFGEKIHMYISAGICDLTQRLKGTKYDEVIFDISNSEETMSKFLDSLSTIKSIVLKEGAIPIFLTIYPMSLSDWNQSRLNMNKTSYLCYATDYNIMQSMLEETVEIVNREIVNINVQSGVITPLIHKHIIHNRGKGKISFKYNLLSDGCHPNHTLQARIASTIGQAICKNRDIK